MSPSVVMPATLEGGLAEPKIQCRRSRSGPIRASPVAPRGEPCHAERMLQVCLNGATTPAEFAALPVRPTDLATAAAGAVAAGAADIHLHPKTADGADSLYPGVV